MKIIPYTDQYKNQLLDFIDTIYREYGDRLFIEGFDKDLLNIEEIYQNTGGMFFLCVNNQNDIIGTIAFKILCKKEKSIEMKRFYIKQELRGSGIADKLYNLIINWCKDNNFKKIILWSDTRFTRSHSYYQKKGFVKTVIRNMDDGAMPYSEYCFELISS